MSRVFSRRPGRRFPLVPALGFVGGRGPSLGNERDAGTASRSREVRPPRKKALDPQPGQGLLSITVEPNATARTARTTKTARIWALAPLPASAQLRLPVSAFLALQTWPVECLMLPPCCGHASCSPCLRAWPPVTSKPW